MKIYRDGKEYELTDIELIEAANELHMKNIENDCKEAFEDLAAFYGDVKAFREYAEEHETEYKKLIDVCVRECDFVESMYGVLGYGTIKDICDDCVRDTNEELVTILGLD